jgi:hypothetical protein
MRHIIEEIDSFSFAKTQLFFDQTRLGEEVRLNLASFPGSRSELSAETVDELVSSLKMAIGRMEIALRALLNNRKAIFYMWHDETAHLLRWSIISDLGQLKLPFSSNVQSVDIREVVNEWATKPMDDSDLLTLNQIEQLTTEELGDIVRAKGVPTINVYVRRVPDARNV